jgi:hypothetical protein
MKSTPLPLYIGQVLLLAIHSQLFKIFKSHIGFDVVVVFVVVISNA